MDITSYMLGNLYTAERAEQLRKITAGKNCSISNVVTTNNATTITFTWKDDDGKQHDTQIKVSNGKNGETPTISVDKTSDGHKVTFKTSTQTKSFDVLDGTKGIDGKSGTNGKNGETPIVTIDEIDGGHKITFKTSVQTKSFDVPNGVNGKDGVKGVKGDKGDNGVGVKNLTIDENNHLIATLSDNSTLDCGQILTTSNVEDLKNVTLTNLANSHILVYDANKKIWKNSGALGTKVDKVTGKGLSTNDYTTPEKTKLSGIAEGAQANVIESISLNGVTVTPTDKNVALNNIALTKDLSNFYKKSDVYTKAEVNNAIKNVKTMAFESVTELPTTDIKTNVIYLVPKANATDGDSKDEYINLDGAWEKIGSTDVDLSNYVTSTAIDAKLKNYTTTTDLNTLLSKKATKTNTLSGYGITNAYTKTEVDSKVTTLNQSISNKVSKVTGKDLSTNDYTTDEKTKLSNVEEGAQANKIESVSINGVAIKADDKKNIDIKTITETDLNKYALQEDTYSKTDADAKFDALQIAVDKKVSVVDGKTLSTNDYTTTEKNKLAKIESGANVNKINGITLNGVVVTPDANKKVNLVTMTNDVNNLQNYYTKASTYTQTQVNTKLSALQSKIDTKVDAVEGKVLSTNDYTTEEKNKLKGVASGAQVNKINSISLNGVALTIDSKKNVDIPVITKDVEDLTNYYKKDEIYSKTDIDTKFADNTTALDGKVDKVTGKGLSTNDYTTTEKNKLKGIANGAQVNKIESISVNGTVIAPDTTKKVNITTLTSGTRSLSNYYLKENTYSKTEIDNIVNALKTSRFKIVSALPTENIETNVVYLVPKANATTTNAKEEYVNLDGTTKGWELIGSTDIDLSDYITTQILAEALKKYTTTTDLNTLLSKKATKTNTLSGYGITNAYTKIETDSLIGKVNLSIDTKVDKVEGKALSTNDYTTAEKNKLSGIKNGAQVNTIETIALNGAVIKPDSNKRVNLTTMTKTVKDLQNYYNKDQCYSKDEIDNLINLVKSGHSSILRWNDTEEGLFRWNEI